MKKLLCVTLLLSIIGLSCVKKEYDFSNLDLTVQVGGDVVYIPIGSTDSILLRKFLNTEEIEMLDTLPDGGYALVIGDSTNLEIPTIDADLLKLDDIVVKRSESIGISNGIDDIKVDGLTVKDSIAIALANEEFPNISLPNLTENDTISSGFYEEYSNAGSPTLPAGLPFSFMPPISMDDLFDMEFASDVLPDMISGVDSILLTSGSKLELTVNLEHALGTTLRIDSLLLEFPEQIKLDQMSPNVSGQFYLVKDYLLATSSELFSIPVSHLAFSSADFQNHILSMDEQVRIFTKYGLAGAYDGSPLPTSSENEPRVILQVNSNLNFASATILVDPVEQVLPSTKIPIDLVTTIDTAIAEIGVVTLDDASLTLKLNVPNISSTVTVQADPLQRIEIKFPALFGFAPGPTLPAGTTLIGNTLRFSGVIPDSVKLAIASLNVNKTLANGELNLNDSVVFSGLAKTTTGKVNSMEFNDLTNKKIHVEASISDLMVEEVQIGKVATSYSDTLSFDFIAEDMPEEIVALDSILLQNTKIRLTLHSNIKKIGGKDVNIRAKIQLPSAIVFEPGQLLPGNILDTAVKFDVNGEWNIMLNLRSIKFDNVALNNGQLKIQEIVNYGVSLSVDDPVINIDDLRDLTLQFGVDVAITGIKFGKVYGKIDPKIEAMHETVSMNELPDMMKDDSLRLDVKPYLDLVMKTNLQIPVGATISLKPYKNGSPIQGAAQTVGIDIDPAPSTEMNATKLWLAATNEGMPDGYKWAEIHLGELVKRIPDSLQIEITPRADATRTAIFDPNVQYKAGVDYKFIVPLAFGQDLNVVIRDTIKNLSKAIGEMMSGNQIGLTGLIWNSIPLELEAAIIPIDSNSRIIDIEPAKFAIKPGAVGNSAVQSDLNIEFNDPDKKLIDLRGFILKFTGKTDPTKPSYIPIKPNNFIQIKMNAKIVGGVVVDLNDLEGENK